jgi:hypothetical protein
MEKLGFKNQKTKNSKFWMHKPSSKNHKLEITNEKTKNHFECKKFKIVNVDTYMLNCNVVCRQTCTKHNQWSLLGNINYWWLYKNIQFLVS